MQPQPKSNKTMLIVIAVLVIAGLGIVFYMSGSPTDANSSLSVDNGGVAAGATSEDAIRILSLLNQVKKIKIDSGFFTSTAFNLLNDHTVQVYPQNVGKSNPFFNPRPPKSTTGASTR